MKPYVAPVPAALAPDKPAPKRTRAKPAKPPTAMVPVSPQVARPDFDPVPVPDATSMLGWRLCYLGCSPDEVAVALDRPALRVMAEEGRWTELVPPPEFSGMVSEHEVQAVMGQIWASREQRLKTSIFRILTQAVEETPGVRIRTIGDLDRASRIATSLLSDDGTARPPIRAAMLSSRTVPAELVDEPRKLP